MLLCIRGIKEFKFTILSQPIFLIAFQKKPDIYSVEIHGTKDLEKVDIGNEKENYKDLKGEKQKGKKSEDLKKELDLVSAFRNSNTIFYKDFLVCLSQYRAEYRG